MMTLFISDMVLEKSTTRELEEIICEDVKHLHEYEKELRTGKMSQHEFDHRKKHIDGMMRAILKELWERKMDEKFNKETSEEELKELDDMRKSKA